MLSSQEEVEGKLAHDAVGSIELIRVDQIIGEVEQFTDQQFTIRGGGGNFSPVHGGHISPVSLTQSSTRFHRVWLESPDGHEITLTLDSDKFPMRSGQMLSIVYAKSTGGYFPMAFFNHSFKAGDDLFPRKGFLEKVGAGLSPRVGSEDGLGIVLALLSLPVTIIAFTAILASLWDGRPPYVESHPARNVNMAIGFGIPVLLAWLIIKSRSGAIVVDKSSEGLFKQARDLARRTPKQA